MCRTIDWCNRQPCAFNTRNREIKNNRHIFSSRWNQRKTIADVTIAAGNECVIVWNPGLLERPVAFQNRLSATLVPKGVRFLLTWKRSAACFFLVVVEVAELEFVRSVEVVIQLEVVAGEIGGIQLICSIEQADVILSNSTPGEQFIFDNRA